MGWGESATAPWTAACHRPVNPRVGAIVRGRGDKRGASVLDYCAIRYTLNDRYGDRRDDRHVHVLSCQLRTTACYRLRKDLHRARCRRWRSESCWSTAGRLPRCYRATRTVGTGDAPGHTRVCWIVLYCRDYRSSRIRQHGSGGRLRDGKHDRSGYLEGSRSAESVIGRSVCSDRDRASHNACNLVWQGNYKVHGSSRTRMEVARRAVDTSAICRPVYAQICRVPYNGGGESDR
jgi:hypothetical protein